MTTGHLEPGAFRALLAGVTDLKRQLDRVGINGQDVRLMVPTSFGKRIEHELMSMDPADWQPFCGGIYRFACGHLMQLILYESIWVGWKTGHKKKSELKPWEAIQAAKSLPEHRLR